MRARALGLWLLALTIAPVRGVVHAEAEPPAVFARFLLTRADGHTEHLELSRQHDRIEHRFVERGYSELWLRDARGELEHVRSFPRDGKNVDYTSGDLRTISLAPDWSALSSLLGNGELASLTQSGSERTLQTRRARVLRGTLRAQPVRLSWLDDVALPARLSLGEGKSKVVISLLSVVDCTPSLCAPPGDPLRSLEFADLGDMEYDPFVRRFLSQDAHGHPSHH